MHLTASSLRSLGRRRWPSGKASALRAGDAGVDSRFNNNNNNDNNNSNNNNNNNNNNNSNYNNERISRAPFHVKHTQLR